MAAAPQSTQIDQRLVGVNHQRWQNARYHVEAGDMGAGDTLAVVWDDSTEEGGLPPSGLEIYLHDGGFTGTSAATYADDAGDTLVLEFYDPDKDDRSDQCDPDPRFVEVVHTLASSVTDGAVTDAQLVASLNADANFRTYAHAGLVSGDPTIFPVGANAQVKLGEGSTADAIAAIFPSTTANNATRTFARQDIVAAAWTASYDASTKTYTITSVAATEKVHVVVTFT
jgi:hypothetical protein